MSLYAMFVEPAAARRRKGTLLRTAAGSGRNVLGTSRGCFRIAVNVTCSQGYRSLGPDHLFCEAHLPKTWKKSDHSQWLPTEVSQSPGGLKCFDIPALDGGLYRSWPLPPRLFCTLILPPAAAFAGAYRPDPQRFVRSCVSGESDQGDSRTCSAVFMMSAEQAPPSGTKATTEQRRHQVLSLGSAGVDFIAMLDRYPPADSKVRTQSLEVMGGGNSGNTLVAASRLGLAAHIATKVGSDGNGRIILEELVQEGVDTSRVIISDDTPSAFTYVIVDREGGTRTCIHTPQAEEILPQEISPDLLKGMSLVHLDSRHTPAAVALARLANERGIPVVVDAEKDRPHFRELLPLADYLICNRDFPQAFTGRSTREEALHDLLHQGRAKLVASTLGAEGCVVMTRHGESPWPEFEDLSIPPRCPMDISSTQLRPEAFGRDGAKMEEDREHVGPGVGLSYVKAGAWPVKESDVVDTTGAGDSFIAAFIYGILHRMGIGRTLALASLVASRKLSKPGARRGIPKADEILSEWPELLATTGPA